MDNKKELRVLGDNAYESPGLIEVGRQEGGNGYDHAHDVFGTEEDHEVGIALYDSYLYSCSVRMEFDQCTDQIQNALMAARSRPHDRRDRLKRHALAALIVGSRWNCSWPDPHHLPWSLRDLYIVAPSPIQGAPSRSPHDGRCRNDPRRPHTARYSRLRYRRLRNFRNRLAALGWPARTGNAVGKQAMPHALYWYLRHRNVVDQLSTHA